VRCQLRDKAEEIVEHVKKQIILQVRAEAVEIVDHRAYNKTYCVARYELRQEK